MAVVAKPRWPPKSVVVNQAVGVTAEEFGCTVREGFDALVARAESTGQTVERIAVRIVQHQGRCRIEVEPERDVGLLP